MLEKHMKQTMIRLLVLALAIQSAPLANAQPADNTHQADHEALRALREKVVTALDNQDVPALTSYFTKDFAFTAVTQDTLTNQAQVKDFMDRMFHGEGALVTSLKTEPKADILTRFLSDNVGICYGSSVDTYTMKTGEVVKMNVRWSATVVKQDGQWKVAVAHVGTDFLNNPVLSRLTSFWKTVVLIVALAGVVVGGIIGWIIGRRRGPKTV
jgi:uncharacterized protein (TIGR02246 family)